MIRNFCGIVRKWRVLEDMFAKLWQDFEDFFLKTLFNSESLSLTKNFDEHFFRVQLSSLT